jgi:hypothetical protein
MARMRRSALTVSTIGLLCLSTVFSGAASAARAAGGVKGDPQPELKPFVIGASDYPGGSVAIEPDGALVVARGITSGNGKVVVCVLARGAGKCSSTVTLSPLSSDELLGVPEVFVPSANHVVVLMGACCDTNPAGSDLLFSSTDGGRTFAAPKRVGTLGSSAAVGAAALIDGDIVFTASDDTNGAEVESIPVNASGPPASTAVATAAEAFDVAIGSYKGGALIASDFLGTDYTTYVAYAPAGRNFDASASYRRVASFAHEQLIAMSGGALLTIQTSGKQALLLRLFNGTSFGAPHVVPGTTGGAAEWFTVDQDPRGIVHVFTERARSAPPYYLFEVSTSTGASWTSPVDLGNAIDSNAFGVALDSAGSGLVVGTASGEPAWGYPVLAAQGASFSLKSSTIKRGNATIGSGSGSPAARGRVVELQVERSGLWYTVATTRESSTGKFSFTIKGTAAGTFSYRAVVADLAGYLMYGYSPARSLRVTS